MSHIFSKIIVGAVLFGVGFSGGALYGNFKLKKETGLHREMLDAANKKKEEIYKKYQEKNLLSAQLSRSKSTLEGEVLNTLDTANKINREKDEALIKNKNLENDIESKAKRIASLEEEVKALTDRLDALNKDREEAGEKYSSEIKGLEEKLKNDIQEKNRIESELKTANSELEKYKTHNRALCNLAEEILARYENKNAIASMVEKEPFIQTKKVELEKYAQEYQDKIEEHRQTQ